MRSLKCCLVLSCTSWLAAVAQADLAKTPEPSLRSEVRRFELGTTASYISTNGQLETCPSSAHWNFGPEVTVNLNSQIAIDGQMHFLAGNNTCWTGYKGGHSIEGLVGPRYSVRDGRISYFGTAKLGFIRWDGAAADKPITSPADVQFEDHTVFAVHFGGGVEWSATQSVRLRAEVGDTLLRNTYPNGKFLERTNNLQMTFGTHYAFGSVLPRREPASSQQNTHKFFDNTNLLLHSLALGGILADGIQTQRHISDCPNSQCRGYWEADPLTRPLVKYGWSGQLALTGLVAGGELFLSHRLHRTRHHRLERAVPIAVTVAGSYMAYRWTKK